MAGEDDRRSAGDNTGCEAAFRCCPVFERHVGAGPVSAGFTGKISLSDIVPQQSYVILGRAASPGSSGAKLRITLAR